jgi:[acyl-carrier-protein] S-malonyltransferase
MAMRAYLFPGQGSQYVGMARDFYEADPPSRELIQKADALLGVPLSTVCFTGPEDELRQTRNTQPAIFLHSILVARKLPSVKPDMLAGHSLGEYSALVSAGAIAFEEALRLVRLRGELMQRAGEMQHGTMAAIVGLSGDDLQSVCDAASSAGIVQPANFNSPGQTVISGSIPGVRRAMEIARERGAKLVKELVVSGAFHSPLMESACNSLREALDAARIVDGSVPVYSNVTAEPVTAASEIRELLYRQLTSPVCWDQSIKNMIRDGAVQFTEIGPGKVLQGLMRRIDAGIRTNGFDRLTDIPTG